MAESRRPEGEREYWLDRPGSVTKVFWAVVGACAALGLLDFFYHKHAELGFDGSFGFHGWYGFVCCVFLVLAAKELRKLLKRDEDHYDR